VNKRTAFLVNLLLKSLFKQFCFIRIPPPTPSPPSPSPSHLLSLRLGTEMARFPVSKPAPAPASFEDPKFIGTKAVEGAACPKLKTGAVD
jgi:hypothetical protein